VIAQVLGQVGGPALAGLLGGGRITPQQAEQVPQGAVEQIAKQAEDNDNSIVDRISDFYAAHPELVKSLGAIALALILSQMHKRG
jgi:hypothetical protein